MKRHFKPEDRTLAYQTFFFNKAMTMVNVYGRLLDDDKNHINRQWEEFTQDFQAFIKSDFNRDDFEFDDCVIGFFQDLIDLENEKTRD